MERHLPGGHGAVQLLRPKKLTTRRRAEQSAESRKARQACLDMDGTSCGTCDCRGECRHAIERLPDADLEAAYGLFCACRTQLRTSFGGVVGLDYNAVWLVASTLGVTMDPWMLMAIQFLEDDLVSECAESVETAKEKS